MKVVVHCGQGKTGSTTLQATLADHRDVLRQHAVCYPAGLLGPDHRGLALLFLDEPHRYVAHTYDGSRRRSEAELLELGRAEWTNIRRVVADESPEVLVLSHESYCRLDSVAEAERLHALLSGLRADIVFCLYVRDPAERCHSSNRQAAKTRGTFRPPAPMRVRGFLESVAQTFDRPASVRVYARETLVGGDIVTDFLTAFLADRIDPSRIVSHARNDSLSSEAASILLAYRHAIMPDRAGRFEPRAGQLRRLLEPIDRTVPRPQPETLVGTLHKDIVRASVDLDWLKEQYRVVLPGITYPVDDGSPLPDFSLYTRFEDVCSVDLARRDELLARLIDRLMPTTHEKRGFLSAIRTRLGAQTK